MKNQFLIMSDRCEEDVMKANDGEDLREKIEPPAWAKRGVKDVKKLRFSPSWYVQGTRFGHFNGKIKAIKRIQRWYREETKCIYCECKCPFVSKLCEDCVDQLTYDDFDDYNEDYYPTHCQGKFTDDCSRCFCDYCN